MKLYILVIQLISAINGDVVHEYHSGEPVTLEACIKTMANKGPIPVRDGLATVLSCQKVETIET